MSRVNIIGVDFDGKSDGSVDLPLHLYDTYSLFCQRCENIGCQYYTETKDAYNTGDSPTEISCEGSLENCPLAEEVQETLAKYRQDPAMTMEAFFEAPWSFWVALSSARFDMSPENYQKLALINIEAYFTKMAIHEVQEGRQLTI